MGNPPVARVTVPMNKHERGLHEGHKAILDVANSIGDRVVVPVLPVHSSKWYNYLLTGTPPVPDSVDISKQIMDVESKGGYFTQMPFVLPSDEDRLRWLNKADSILPLFSEYIHTRSHYILARGVIADLCRQIERSQGNVKYTVRGPEFHQFLTKAVKPLLGSQVEVIIIDRIYKDDDSHIKLQGSINNIYEPYKDEIYKIPQMLIGIKPYLKVGGNEDLINELNNAYQHVHWKIHGISVIEGGIVPGRLETIQFMFPSNVGGTVIVEDVTYEGV